MLKNSIFLIILSSSIMPIVCSAADMDNIKADFLRGNYRRVIFEGSERALGHDIIADELNYILGLSFLKEGKPEEARRSFLRIESKKYKEQAKLGIADSYLTEGKFQEARDIYIGIIDSGQESKLRSRVLYRLNLLESKTGSPQKADAYFSELKGDFPLALELRKNSGILVRNHAGQQAVYANGAAYSVQVGFFYNSSNASKLKNKLLAENFSAYIEKSTGGYRVQAGRFNNMKDAQKLLDELSKEGYPGKICEQ